MTRHSSIRPTLHGVAVSSIALGCFLVTIGCTPEAVVTPEPGMASLSHAGHPEPAAPAKYSAWSTPQNLGAVVNSTANEQNAQLSKDGLAIYFSSDRGGGLGGLDIYVTRRASLDSPWGTPDNLGAPVNTSSLDFAPNVSIDGHLLFFASSRPDGEGGSDLYMSWRDDVTDDKAWSEPVNLGPPVNTTENEQAPNYLQNAEEGRGNLYFNRGLAASNLADLYYAAVSRDGVALGPVVYVEGLNTDQANEQAATLRHDAKEVFFFSNRLGGKGGNDIWTSTRQNASRAWSAPTNVESLNTTSADVTPNPSFDGLTMLLGSSRTGTMGGNDIWMTTRTKR